MEPAHDLHDEGRGRSGGRWIGLAVCVLILAAVANLNRPRESEAGPGAPARSLGELTSRDYTLRLSTGPGGTVVCAVVDASGRVLAEGLSPEDVYRQFPDLDVTNLHAGPDDEPARLEPGH